MSKFRLTVSNNTVIEYEEVVDETQRRTFESFYNQEDLINYLREHQLETPPDGKIGLVHSGAMLGEITIIPRDNINPIEYVFDSQEEADTFSKRQGYKKSIHMMPLDVQEVVQQFFNNGDCDFENCERLREKYKIDLESAGGAECPDCTRNSIMRKYQDKILLTIETNKENK